MLADARERCQQRRVERGQRARSAGRRASDARRPPDPAAAPSAAPRAPGCARYRRPPPAPRAAFQVARANRAVPDRVMARLAQQRLIAQRPRFSQRRSARAHRRRVRVEHPGQRVFDRRRCVSSSRLRRVAASSCSASLAFRTRSARTCGSAAFCVSRAYCSSAPAAAIASGSTSRRSRRGPACRTARQQPRAPRQLEVPGRAVPRCARQSRRADRALCLRHQQFRRRRRSSSAAPPSRRPRAR
jgi:hypothetical protein